MNKHYRRAFTENSLSYRYWDFSTISPEVAIVYKILFLLTHKNLCSRSTLVDMTALCVSNDIFIRKSWDLKNPVGRDPGHF